MVGQSRHHTLRRLLRLLLVLERDLVADEPEVLPKHTIEVSDFLSREHRELHDDEQKIQDAEDGLRQVGRARRHLVVLPQLLDEEPVASNGFFAREDDVGRVDDHFEEEELFALDSFAKESD